MIHLSTRSFLLMGAACLALTACDSGKKQDDNAVTSDAASEAATSQTAEKMVDKVMEVLKLDTSSMESFTASLSAMKESLSAADASKLTSALTSLAKESAGDSNSLMNAAKSMASGASMEETLYKTMGDKLNGLTFEDVVKLAN